MPLRRDPGNGKVFTVECPLCGAGLDDETTDTSQHYFEEHGPGDIGLPPLGIVDDDYLPDRRLVSAGVEKQSSLATFGGAP